MSRRRAAGLVLLAGLLGAFLLGWPLIGTLGRTIVLGGSGAFHRQPTGLDFQMGPGGPEPAAVLAFPTGPARLGLPGPSELVLARTYFDAAAREGWTEITGWELGAGPPRWTFSLRNDLCCSPPVVAAAETGRALLAAGNAVSLLDAGGDLLVHLPLEEGEFTFQGSLDRGGRWLAVSTSRQRVLLWTGEGRLAWSRSFPGRTLGVDLSSEGDLFAVATNEELTVRRLPSLEEVARVPLGFAGTLVQPAFASRELLVVVGYDAQRRLRLATVHLQHGRLSERTLEGFRLPLVRREEVVEIQDLTGGGWLAVDASGRLLSAPAAGDAWLAGALHGDRLALSRGGDLELRPVSGGPPLWTGAAPGNVHVLELGEDWLAALGRQEGSSPVPDRLWLWKLP